MEASFKFLLYMLGAVLLFLVAVVTIATAEHWFSITSFPEIGSLWEMSKLWIDAFLAIYVIYLGVTVGLAIVGWLTAEKLVNKPNQFRPKPDENDVVAEYRPSRFGFFTSIEPGMIKLVVMMGGRFRYMIMNHAGHTFKGYTKEGQHLKMSEDEYWEVVETPDGEQDCHPVHFKPLRNIWDILALPFSLPWWAWKRFVYMTSGYVFSGIYPFQMMFVYPIERFLEETSGTGEIELKRIKDFTDFYFAKQFIFWFPVGSADTRDGGKVKIYVTLTMRTVNAFKLAWRTTEEWSSLLLSTASSTLNDVTRIRFLKSILASENGVDTAKNAIADQLQALGGSEGELGKHGLVIEDVYTPDRSAVSKSLETAIEAEAAASYEAKAQINRARGNATATRMNARGIRGGGKEALIAAHLENRVQVAKAGGDNAVINIGMSSESDPYLPVVYKELRDGRGGDTTRKKKRSKKQ